MSDFSISQLTRRDALKLGAAGAVAAASVPAFAQQPTPQPAFGYEDVVRRARDLAKQPYDPAARELPEELRNLSFDRYRDIRFRPDRSLLAAGGAAPDKVAGLYARAHEAPVRSASVLERYSPDQVARMRDALAGEYAIHDALAALADERAAGGPATGAA